MARKDNNPGKREAIAQRRLEAFRLRTQGLSYTAIGEQLKVDRCTAFGDVKAVLAKLHKEQTALADAYVQLESARLDSLWKTFYEKATNGDLRSAEFCLKVSERRSKLLGLDGPSEANVMIAATTLNLPSPAPVAAYLESINASTTEPAAD